MSKVADKIKQRKRKRSQQLQFVPVTPTKPVELIKVVELDLFSSAYFDPEKEEQNFDIGQDEIQFMIDSLTEQRNDYATKAAAWQSRAKLLHTAVVDRNRLLLQYKARIDQLESEQKEK